MTDFEHTFTFWDFGDTELPASYSADENGNVALNTVHFGPKGKGRDVTAAWVHDVISAKDFDWQIERTERWWAEEGYARHRDNEDADAADADYRAARDGD